MDAVNRERTRLVAQILLLTIAVGAAGAAVWRFQVSRSELEESSRDRVIAQPARGPVGMRPLLVIDGWQDGTEVTVLLCMPTGTEPGQGCAQIAKGRSGGTLSASDVSPVPASIGDTVVEPGRYKFRARAAGENDFADHGSFEVVPFAIGAAPEPAEYGPGAVLKAAEPRQIAEGLTCLVQQAPDGRLLIGKQLVDPRTGVIVELGIEGAEVAWSPDGEQVALITGDRKEIRVAQPDGTDAHTVVREARGLISSLTWAPDGDRLAYVARSDPNARGGPGSPTVFVFSLVEGPLGTAGGGESVAWDPKGDRLVVEAAGGVLEFSDLQGGRTRLTEGRRPAWSADGTFVAFVRFADAEAGEVWYVRAAGGPGTQLVGGGVCAVAFSADGGRLITVDREGDTTKLNARRLTPGE